MQEAPQQKRLALVLLDSSLGIVSYTAEAIRVLTYPRDAKSLHSILPQVDAKLRSLLDRLRCSPPNQKQKFKSGRRLYHVQMFDLTPYPNCVGSMNGSSSVHTLLLERCDPGVVDLSTAAEQFHLTPREYETVELLLQGLTTKEIANAMGISSHTVKAFLRLVMSKMHVSTRSGIIGKIVRLSR